MTEHWLKLRGTRRFASWEQAAREAQFKSSRMAFLFGISERHLQRIFKCHFRCRPSRWLRQLQFELAKELVEQGYSTKAAAFETGFRSIPHFCREFKKLFGHPPQTFATDRGAKCDASSLMRSPVAQEAGSIGRAGRRHATQPKLSPKSHENSAS